MGRSKVAWLDVNVLGLRILVWRSLMWQRRPILDRDFYGGGYTVLWWGPLWLEWGELSV